MTLKRLALVQRWVVFSLKISLFGCHLALAASILFLSIFGHKIGVLKPPALFQGKELQVTCFKVNDVLLVLSNKEPVTSVVYNLHR